MNTKIVLIPVNNQQRSDVTSQQQNICLQLRQWSCRPFQYQSHCRPYKYALSLSSGMILGIKVWHFNLGQKSGRENIGATKGQQGHVSPWSISVYTFESLSVKLRTTICLNVMHFQELNYNKQINLDFKENIQFFYDGLTTCLWCTLSPNHGQSWKFTFI